MAEAKHYGLIGKRLEHSLSKTWFEARCAELGMEDRDYALIELESLAGLRTLVAARRLRGFNVTIPYKRDIVPLLDSLSETAREIGAVNVVEVRRDAASADGLRLHGRNTDGPAFLETLRPLLQPWHREALILGTGGAAQAVAWALRQAGIGYTFVSRHPEGRHCIGYQEAMHSKALLIVNATPVGMASTSEVQQSPWPNAECIGPKHLCYDLIYNPLETLFLHSARQAGATIKNGLEMLHRQAEMSGFWKEED